ncbi:hypothetical protein [Saccharothrix hoggarensis]|uniref:Uncharacterized protein n=1 Tax=Saccharothrix hoggarensis TaxID=913853 RepID=A0ABW3QWL4_9PSEU
MPTLTITANYRRHGDDWAITVRADDKELDATAPGLIAARLAADQLVDELAVGRDRAVVHLLDGDAFAFSVAYLHTRAGLAPPAGKPAANAGHSTANTKTGVAVGATAGAVPAAQAGTAEASTTHDQVIKA